MLKRVLKRSASLLLAIVMLVSLFPAMTLSVAAAEEEIVEGLNANGDFTGITGGISLEATSTPYKGGYCETAAAAKSATVTLTSTLNVEAKLSFDYTVIVGKKSDSSVTINGTAQTVNDHFEQTIAGGAEIKIEVFSGTPDKSETTTYTSKIEITNISLSVDKMVTTTFQPTENGSYTVDDANVTETYIHTKNATETTTLVATPAEGYIFLGWYSQKTEKFVSLDANWVTHLTDEQTIEARFAPATDPIFQVGTDFRSPDLKAAVEFATTKGPKTVVLIQSGTLPAGDYRIPGGVTLLIPFDEAHTLYTKTPGNTGNAWTNPYVFRKLTMASGATLTVANGGVISVSAKFAARGGNGNPNGGTTGPYGQIKMDADSSIVVENGGALYAWGYISGDGEITAKSGSTVYEYFQIADFRGGSATNALTKRKEKIFPFSQYYIQNIELPITFETGAQEKGYTGLYAGSTVTTTELPFIGSSGALFNLTSGTLRKEYDPVSDRLIVDVDGNMAVDEINVSGAARSSDYVLPVNGNITLNVNGGTITIKNDTSLLPGVIINIGETATFAVEKNLYVYGRNEWVGKKYTMLGDLYPAVYSATSGRKKRATSDLVDVSIIVGGTLQVNGNVYTTESGANITGSGESSKVVFKNAPVNGALYELINNKCSGSSWNATIPDDGIATVPITSAQLKNADGTYTQTEGTAANDKFVYADNFWHKLGTDPADPHSWNDGEVTKAATCTEKGVKTFTCSVCGKTKTEEIDMIPHTEVTDAAKAPTCTETGLTEGKHCSVCKEVLVEQKTVAAKGHTEVIDKAVEPTCTETGLTEGKHCSVCNTVLVAQETVAAKDHKSGEAKQENVVNATCTAEGSYDEVVYCTECKTELNRVKQTNAKLGHDWSDWTTTKTPTCVAEGERKHTCQRTGCIAFETEAIAINPNNHSIVTDSAVAATCYRTGLTEGKHCKDCGKVLVAQETVEKLPHTYGEPKWTWTETDDGYTAAATFTCTNNGCTNTVEDHAKTVNADVSSAVTAEATCTTIGVRTYTAKVTFEGKEYTCGETKMTDIPMVDHTAGEAKQENVVNATCTVAGSYDEVVYCTVCGEKLSSTPKIIEKLPHTLEQVDAKEATCTEPGNIAYWTCKDCTGVFSDAEGKNAIAQKDTVIAALEHDYKAEITAPTCTADGYTTHTCSRCNDSYKDSTTEKLGHSFTHYVSNGDATCKADGTKTAQCERCDATNTVADEGSKLPHTWSAEWSKDGNYHWHVCTECGALDTKTGHSWNDGEVTKAATCTEKGVKTFTCTVCGQTKTEEISEKGHKPVEIPAVPATCTATGLTAGEKCSVCDAILTPQETTPVKAHQLTKVEAKEATCMENGNYEYWTCKDCQGVFSDSEGKNAIKLENTVITAGHKWSDWEETPATCQAQGKRTRTCADCGKVETETIDQLSHDLRHVPANAATCENEGNIAHYLCDLCGHFFKDEKAAIELNTVTTPALEHQWGDWTVSTAPGCETKGEEIRICERDGTHVDSREIPAVGHKYGDPIWTWTGTVENKEQLKVTAEFDCTRCMDTQILDANVVHAYRPATCTGEGADEYIATVTFGETEDGEPRTYTDVSGYVISPLGHVYDKEQADVWTWTQDENGNWAAAATLICTACGDELTLEGEDVTLTQELTTEPECEEPGERTYTAKVTVGALTYTDEHKQSVEPLGHDLVHHDAKAPNCTEIGWDAYDTCSRCDYTTRGADIEALGHAWDEGVITTEPTCTAEGVMTYTCSVCGETKTEPVEKAAHQTVRVDEKAPTCTEDGNYRYWQCRECRGLFSDELGQQPTTLEEKRISATGHHYDPETVEFIWTENDLGGWSAKATITCACGEELPAVNAQITFEDLAATCEEDGIRTFTATAELDGEVYTDVKKAPLLKLGHSYEPSWNWNGNTAATLTLTCNECGKEETVTAIVTSSTQGNTTTYTAVAEFAGSTYRDEKTVTNTPSGGGGGGMPGGASGGSASIDDEDVPLASVLPFDDMAESDWFYDAVKYVYENELMSGTSDNTFDPHMDTTRGMIVTILYRVAEGNVTVEEAFDDVSTTAWYSEAVTWGVKNDVVSGYGNGQFGPNDEITREQLVSILWRYLGKPAAKSAALPFSDAGQVSDYAREAMQWALEQGIIHGKSETILDPRGHATRAETAAILSRYLELTKAEE